MNETNRSAIVLVAALWIILMGVIVFLTWAWTDEMIDRVGDFQLRNFEECSYAPLARALPLMLHEEQFHIAIGVNGVRRAFKEYFKGVQPARTTVEAAAPRQGVNVEIDAIA